jgi:hypothetical protein
MKLTCTYWHKGQPLATFENLGSSSVIYVESTRANTHQPMPTSVLRIPARIGLGKAVCQSACTTQTHIMAPAKTEMVDLLR